MNEILKELQDVVAAVRKAKEDGKLKLKEALVILKELGELAAIALPLVIGFLGALEHFDAGKTEAAAGESDSKTQ